MTRVNESFMPQNKSIKIYMYFKLTECKIIEFQK